MRTTLDLDKSVLEELKQVQRQEGGSLGKIASSLLAEVLRQKLSARAAKQPAFHWKTSAMSARIDLNDKDTLYQVLDQS